MASIQEKLEKAQQSVRNKLFDNQITITGISTKVVRLKATENKYGDDITEIISKNEIDVVIKYPGKVPITDYMDSKGNTENRNNEFTDVGTADHLFLMDIVPIDLFVESSNDIARKDLLIHKIEIRPGHYMKMILQVTEFVGDFQSTVLRRMYQCSPYHGIISPEIQNIIDLY